jgi:2-oxoglutarate ferredoxin oxidoreductase subunit gamma
MPRSDAISEVAIRICGIGGQGIVLAANLLAESFAGRLAHATTSTSYGPEVRGTSVRADVRASSQWIDYPRVDRPSFIIALAQKEYNNALQDAAEGALIMYDPATVNPKEKKGVEQAAVEAAQMSEDNFGGAANANLVMLGAAAAHLREIDFDALVATVRARVSEADSAVRALEIGLAAGKRGGAGL